MTPAEIAELAEGLARIAASGGVSNEDLTVALALAGSALAAELARKNGSAGDAERRRFWEGLIAGAHLDAGSARDEASACGVKVAPQYLPVAIEIEPNDDSAVPYDNGVATAIRAFFAGSGNDVGCVVRGAVLVVLAPAAREIDAQNARTAAALLPKTLAKRHTGIKLVGGVGSVAPLHALRDSVERAQAALQIARRLYGSGHVGVYDELGAYPLLFEGADTLALQSFAQRVLAPLRAYDEKHQTDLERTLRVYFHCGQNVKTAAADLNVHRHTVFYRLRQIGEIAGCSLDTPHDQLTLRLAIAIDALHT